MYLELTDRASAADADEAIGAVVLTGTDGVHLRRGPGRDGGNRDGQQGRGLRSGLPGPARLPRRHLRPAARRGQRRRRRPRASPCWPTATWCSSTPAARLRVPFSELGVPPEAASSFLFPAVMGWQRAAASSHLGLGGAEELVDLGLALRCARARHRPRPDRGVGGAYRRVPVVLHPCHHLAHAAARRDAVPRGQPARAGRLRPAALGGAARAGPLAEFAAKRHPDRAPRHHRRADRPATSRRPRWPSPSRSSASTRSGCPSTRTSPCREDIPPALVEGVRLDDYKRCLDPLVALATAATVTDADRPWHRHPAGRPARPDRPGQAGRHPRPPVAVAGSRWVSGIGWNRAEAEDHGVDFARRWPSCASTSLPWRRSGRATRPSSTASSSTSARRWSWPKPVQQPRVRTLIGGAPATRARRGGRLRRRVAPHRRQRPGRGAYPACARWPKRPGRDPAALSVVPFGTIADGASSSTTPALGVSEVVLRIRAGTLRRGPGSARPVGPLVPFAATLESP